MLVPKRTYAQLGSEIPIFIESYHQSVTPIIAKYGQIKKPRMAMTISAQMPTTAAKKQLLDLDGEEIWNRLKKYKSFPIP